MELVGGDSVDNFGEAEVVGCHPRLRIADGLIVLGTIAPDMDCCQGIVVVNSMVCLILVQDRDDRGCGVWSLYVLPQVPSAKAVEGLGFPLSIIVINAIVGELRELGPKGGLVLFVGHLV